MSKKLMYMFLMLLLVGCLPVCAKETADGKQETEAEMPIYFFHNTACGSCDGTEEFVQIVEDEISYYKEEKPYELLMYNVFKTGGKKEWDSVKAEYGLEKEDYIFPVMVLDGKMYTGLKEIEEKLHHAYLDALGISAVYFYRKDCQECTDMESYWEGLEEELKDAKPEGSRKEQQISPDGNSAVLWMESRTDNHGDLIRNLFESYEVPDKKQMVPFVFLKDTYLAGQEEIEGNLSEAIKNGHGFDS